MRLRAILIQVVAATALGVAALAQGAKPSVPSGRDPGGVAIALIGTGIDYTLPLLARRLARDGEGELIGWDLEDKDRKPFDKSKGGTRPEWGGDGTACREPSAGHADPAAGAGARRRQRSRVGGARHRLRGADAGPRRRGADVGHDAARTGSRSARPPCASRTC